jgi:hypothetical protein
MKNLLAGRRSVWLDVAGVAVAWAGWVAWLGRGRMVFAYDVFRDMAYAHGVLAGRPWSDPSLPGLAAWYPPGNPFFMAALARLTGVSLTHLYGTSVYWLQWTLPILLFLLVRAGWGRWVAWLALPFVFLGSLWWLTHAAMPMPSVQGIAFTLAALLAWLRASRGGGWIWVVAAGLLAGLGIWTHVIDGAFAAGAILLHGAIGLIAPGDKGAAARRSTAARGAIASLLAAAVSAPVWLHQMRIARVNDAPIHWFAPELHEAGFALQVHAPLVPLVGLLGLGLAARSWARNGWLVAWFALGLFGELAGYAGHDLGWPVPWVIPHEFQWHTQVAIGIAAATAIPWLAVRTRRAAVAAVVIACLAPAVFRLPAAGSFLVRPSGDEWRDIFDLGKWLESHTSVDDVLVADPEASYLVAAVSGRKVVALPPGHMNPAVDPRPRLADLQEMLATSDELEFSRRAARYGARYLIVHGDPSGPDTLRGRYESWQSLAPQPTGTTAIRLYRIATPW